MIGVSTWWEWLDFFSFYLNETFIILYEKEPLVWIKKEHLKEMAEEGLKRNT